MSSVHRSGLGTLTRPLLPAFKGTNWYAIHTKPRREKWIVQQLGEKGLATLLPLLQQISQWSDRRRKVDRPMFSCYAFVEIEQSAEERLKVLCTPGVFSFVGNDHQGTPIPAEQIQSLRAALKEKIPCTEHPFITEGQQVRIRGGALDGTQGVLVARGDEHSVVISVELLHRSIAIRVEGYRLELV